MWNCADEDKYFPSAGKRELPVGARQRDAESEYHLGAGVEWCDRYIAVGQPGCDRYIAAFVKSGCRNGGKKSGTAEYGYALSPCRETEHFYFANRKII